MAADSGKLPKLTEPILTRLFYCTTVLCLQNLLIRPHIAIRDISNWMTPKEPRPHLIKHYPAARNLSVRIFFPPSYDQKTSTSGLIPVLFTVHGGGFIGGSPPENDHLNSRYATDHGFLVVSLSYGLAPFNPFPGPVHDIEKQILAVLDDPELPVDKSRVALMGWSAGGQIVLGAAQLPSLRGRIHALIPLYSVCDFAFKPECRIPTRQWKPALGGFRGRSSDLLTTVAPLAEWAYVSAGHDRRDPILSAVFASRDVFPRNMFVVACEIDQLAHESWRLICGLTGREHDEQVGRETIGERGELILNDERYYFEDSLDGGRYTWLLVPDAVHGFDHDISGMARGDLEVVADGKLKADKVHAMIAEWLKRCLKATES